MGWKRSLNRRFEGFAKIKILNKLVSIDIWVLNDWKISWGILCIFFYTHFNIVYKRVCHGVLVRAFDSFGLHRRVFIRCCVMLIVRHTVQLIRELIVGCWLMSILIIRYDFTILPTLVRFWAEHRCSLLLIFINVSHRLWDIVTIVSIRCCHIINVCVSISRKGWLIRELGLWSLNQLIVASTSYSTTVPNACVSIWYGSYFGTLGENRGWDWAHSTELLLLTFFTNDRHRGDHVVVATIWVLLSICRLLRVLSTTAFWWTLPWLSLSWQGTIRTIA